MKSLAVLSVGILTILSVAVDAEEANKVDFAKQVLPILSNKCFICHGPDAEEDALRLDAFETATGDRGGYRAIDPEKPTESELLTRIHSSDDPMPPEEAEKQLTDAERTVLSEWVKQGGSYAKHWAFVSPKKTTAFSSIDQFIEKKHTESKVAFSEPADKSTLARRAALTLTGLPPEPAQLSAFMGDSSEDAYERYVQSLFASPRYGEHQARYWLDAVRYGDTHGLHLDNRRGIFPFRDWVVRAFNQNLPLDDFITWQLAGDLLPNPTLEQRVATGFVRMNPSTSEGGAIPAEFQAKNNFDRTETFGTVMLGMSLTCARCHTHKYDPISQTEYYRLLAFFNSTAESALDGNKYDYGPNVKAPTNQAGWTRFVELESERQKLFDSLMSSESCLPKELTEAASDNDRLVVIGKAEGPFKNTSFQKEASDLLTEFAALEKEFTTTLVAKELDKPRETKVLRRGEYDQPIGDAVEPGILSVMGRFPEGADRNRMGLAKWLTSREHPLVSRVLVNRIWQRVFGYGLVRTPEDFGLQGQQATHPELLDWLAVEMQESGWDLQHMLRLMLISKTFQQSSAWRAEVDDPANKLFARGPSYRLDAEVIRDLGLWTSELLDPMMGGEGVKPYQPDGMWKALAHPASNTKKYERDSGQLLYRRSLYVYWKRTSPHPMMTLFDAPDRESSCVRRSRTNTSLQSLGLLNETQRIEMSRKFAARLLTEAKTDEARIDMAFTMLACRNPTQAERHACEQLLKTMRDRYRDSKDDAVALLSQGDASQDETLDSMEHAAWTQVAVTLLASDIALLLY